jgi:hypothetical protein
MAAVVLLGAGASRDAGLPTSAGLLTALRDKFDSEQANAFYDFLAAGVALRNASERASGRLSISPNVEDVANALDALIDRQRSDVAPFVASWHPLLSSGGLPSTIPFVATNEVSTILQQKFLEASNGQIDTIKTDWFELASRLISAFNQPRLSDDILKKLRVRLPVEVLKLLSVPLGADLSYLAQLQGFTDGGTALPIATLNYDLTLESALKAAGYTYSDGLEGWINGSVDIFPASCDIHIYKLHGSADWEHNEAQSYRRSVDDMQSYQPAIIFGGRNKLTVRGPYLDMLWRWRHALEVASVLIIAGYSFADDHLNGLIVQWARTTYPGGRKVIVIDPEFESNNSETARWLRLQRSRAGGAKLKLVVIAKGAREGIPDALVTHSAP